MKVEEGLHNNKIPCLGTSREGERVSSIQSLHHSQRKAKNKKRFSLKLVILLMLVSSMISAGTVGGALYAKFSGEVQKQSELIQRVNFASNSKNNVDFIVKSSDFLNLSLPKGSPVTQIARKVGPSIVGIRMTTADSRNDFFGLGNNQSESEGSGIIIRQDGTIMTNYHVVENADPKNGLVESTTLEVFLPDKRQVKAKFIGGDKENDLAVIKISLSNLPVAELGNSSKLEVGESVVAIGNPLGMEFAGSVTVGVVSALNRSVTTGDKILSLIQTDAAINPGNSGGALVNSMGQIIGINSIKISREGVEGLGFAIPINTAKPIVEQLRMFGYIKGRPSTGISGIEITQALSQYYDLPVGIYVSDVEAGSGAKKAGIVKGDVILSLGGKTVKTMKELEAVIKTYKAGDTVNVLISRDGDKKTFKLTFSEQR